MRNLSNRAVLSLLCAALLNGCATATSRHPQAALDHFFKVDDQLYRGAQPTAEGFETLKQLGIKTVISLRAQREDERQVERNQVEALGMRYYALPMRMFLRPTDEQVKQFLAIALKPANQPAFIHCQRGQDRTGSLVAVYRVIKQQWKPKRAYKEAVELGMATWNPFMRDLIMHQAKRISRTERPQKS